MTKNYNLGLKMKTILIFFIAAFLSVAALAQTNWTIDKTHSNVRFTVTYLVISEVEGVFNSFNGEIISSEPDFSDAEINFEVDINSIDTDNQKRDSHLKSDDFFNAEKFPQMTFKSTSFSKDADNKYTLSGYLKIRDITKPVVFDVSYGGTIKDGYGNNRAGFKAKTTINRFDYGLRWDAVTEAGSAVVGKEVDISLNLQFIQSK